MHSGETFHRGKIELLPNALYLRPLDPFHVRCIRQLNLQQTRELSGLLRAAKGIVVHREIHQGHTRRSPRDLDEEKTERNYREKSELHSLKTRMALKTDRASPLIANERPSQF